MQSMLNLRATHGVPLCLSSTTNPLSVFQEMADHDRRRKAMRRKRRQRSLIAREEVLHANQQTGTQRNVKGDEDGDLHDLSHTQLGLTAKAA